MWGVHMWVPLAPPHLYKEPVWFPKPLILGQEKTFSKTLPEGNYCHKTTPARPSLCLKQFCSGSIANPVPSGGPGEG